MRRGLLGLLLLVAACGSQSSEQAGQSATGAGTAEATSTSTTLAASTTAAPTTPPPPPARPKLDASAIAAVVAKASNCPKDPRSTSSSKSPRPVALLFSPLDPKDGDQLRVFALPGNAATDETAEPADGIVIVGPKGDAIDAQAEHRVGPPSSVFADVTSATAGTYRFVAHKNGDVVACSEIDVSAGRARRAGGPQGIPWEVTRAWDREMEGLYSAWVEKLFDARGSDSFSFGALHEITTDPGRNFLHDYLGLAEDEAPPKGLRLDPDCADLPYFLRAYFSFKLGLPFAYSACSRGGGGQAPRCQDHQSNVEPLDEAVTSRFRRFERFARSDLKNVVHSGTGRTLATDDKTDYYPIKLSAETLRPGAVFADPYGHILVVAKRIPQTDDTAGLLFAVDGQPDGTVSRKRFWRGNFLFSLDDPAMGSPGFKRFRPVQMKAGRVVQLSNDAIAKSSTYGDYSIEQTEGDAERFYDKMDDVLSPKPLDPERALLATIAALEEQVKARVISVENGEKHFRDGGRGVIEMPNGASIFETTGDWENFSTPSRDLRILIAIDVIQGFPALVARRPDRFRMPQGTSKDDVVRQLQELLKKETEKRRIEYVRTDGSKFSISLADVLSRATELEMAYNPNDCAEARWGAPKGSAEAATCKRRAGSAQVQKMAKYRSWFHDRKRPSRQ